MDSVQMIHPSSTSFWLLVVPSFGCGAKAIGGDEIDDTAVGTVGGGVCGFIRLGGEGTIKSPMMTGTPDPATMRGSLRLAGWTDAILRCFGGSSLRLRSYQVWSFSLNWPLNAQAVEGSVNRP